jgi:Pentapeptide repeats (8 copies)
MTEAKTYKFAIKTWITGEVLFEASLDVKFQSEPKRVQMGEATKQAYLRGAYLRGADLQGADLRGAYLRGADLRGADLRGAYLRGADLQGAYLRGADLQGADLRGAYLRGADLRGADLRGADLQGAYLRGADLRGAYLQGADLRGAYLQGVKIYIAPIGITGLHWDVLIYAEYMKIGCEIHSIKDWEGFDYRRILEMSGKNSAVFWKENKKLLLPMAKAHAKAHLKAKKEFEATQVKEAA